MLALCKKPNNNHTGFTNMGTYLEIKVIHTKT